MGGLRNGAVVKLRSLLGQELATYRYDGTGTMTIGATMLPVGIYLLKAKTLDSVVMERVAVVR